MATNFCSQCGSESFVTRPRTVMFVFPGASLTFSKDWHCRVCGEAHVPLAGLPLPIIGITIAAVGWLLAVGSWLFAGDEVDARGRQAGFSGREILFFTFIYVFYFSSSVGSLRRRLAARRKAPPLRPWASAPRNARGDVLQPPELAAGSLSEAMLHIRQLGQRLGTRLRDDAIVDDDLMTQCAVAQRAAIDDHFGSDAVDESARFAALAEGMRVYLRQLLDAAGVRWSDQARALAAKVVMRGAAVDPRVANIDFTQVETFSMFGNASAAASVDAPAAGTLQTQSAGSSGEPSSTPGAVQTSHGAEAPTPSHMH